jgi:uncharacterized protein
MVCQSTGLSEKDRTLSGLFREASMGLPAASIAALTQSEINWIAQVEQCASAGLYPDAVACVGRSYGERIDQLRALTAARPSGSGVAPSFSCGGNRSVVEGMICADEALAALDRALASAYAQKLLQLGRGGRAALESDEVVWVAKRNECGRQPAEAIAQCIRAAYDERLRELRG